MFRLLLKLLSKIFFFTGLVGGKNGFSKPLSAKEEKELFIKLRNGDKSAEEKLVKHNLRLVAYIVKKYKNFCDQEELISVGSVGLLKAVRSFDATNGNCFSTYASRCVENEILMLFRKEKKHNQNVSLEATIMSDKDGNGLSLGEIISDGEELLSSSVDKNLTYQRITKIIESKLDSREKEVIYRRFGLKGFREQTQSEVGKALLVSRSYISRIEKNAINIIRDELTKIQGGDWHFAGFLI